MADRPGTGKGDVFPVKATTKDSPPSVIPLASSYQLVNGSVGDPVLLIDYPGRNDAILLDAGDNGRLSLKTLGDLEAVFITHHHVDHFIGLDRIIRANIDSDKVLSLFGPPGTIQKIYDRIKAYEYPFFPFQKIILSVNDVFDDHLVVARLECTKRFPAPVSTTIARDGRAIYETPVLRVESVSVDHTVPCLAYAVIEKAGIHPDRERIAASPLKTGPWIAEVLDLTRANPPNEPVSSSTKWPVTLDIAGGRYLVTDLVERYFRARPERRIAFVTDTAWSSKVQEVLTLLCQHAVQLYCDCFYSQADSRSAAKHKHMTVNHTTQLAQAACVEELVLMHFSQRYRGRYDQLLAEARQRFARTTAVIEPT